MPAEYLEEFKASLEQAKDDVFAEAAPVPVPAPMYVLVTQIDPCILKQVGFFCENSTG